MHSKALMIVFASIIVLLGGLTSTSTTTTFVAAMSIANQDLERYFRTANATHTFATMTEERIAMDVYNYAFLNWSYVDGQDLVESNYKEEQARYGEGKIMGASGKLVHISNVDDITDDYACTPHISGTLGVSLPPKSTPWIALVRRGRCTFEDKVKHVHSHNAIGVIIYNDKPVMQLEKMQIKGKNRNITAVITYQKTGIELVSIVDKGNDVYINIIEGRNGMRPISTLNRTSVLFVSISFIVLMIISLVWLIFYYIQRFRYLQAKDQQSRNLCSVTKKAIMKIPTKTGKMTDEKDLDSDCCAICIEAYKPSDIIRILPCKHEFHKTCIDPWLIEHRTCPMCKLDVLKFYGYVFLGSEESILEYEPERQQAAARSSNNSSNGNNSTVNAAHGLATSAVVAAAVAATSTGVNGVGNTVRGSVLGDLIRSRDFVIDFPRVFVLETGSVVGARETLFPARLPERSQSSLSLQNARDWMNTVTNKLEEQHGLRRQRKDEMQENLLAIRESMRQRRSRSADGRYATGCFGSSAAAAREQTRRERRDARDQQEGLHNRHNSTATLQNLTEAAYAQSRQRQREGDDNYGFVTSTRRRYSPRRDSRDAISMHAIAARSRRISRGSVVTQNSNDSTSSAPSDVNIQIQINGEGVNLE